MQILLHPQLYLLFFNHIQHFPTSILCPTTAKNTFLSQYVCQNLAIFLSLAQIPFFIRRYPQLYQLAFISLSPVCSCYFVYASFPILSWWAGTTFYSVISTVLCNTRHSEKSVGLNRTCQLDNQLQRSTVHILHFYSLFCYNTFPQYHRAHVNRVWKSYVIFFLGKKCWNSRTELQSSEGKVKWLQQICYTDKALCST